MPNGGGLIHIITDRLALHRAGGQSLFVIPSHSCSCCCSTNSLGETPKCLRKTAEK